MTPADRNKWALVVAGLVLLALAGSGVYWFFDNYERREREVLSDPSREAVRNPYLAAERYLSRLGYEAETLRGRNRLKNPPAASGALVVHDAGPSLSPYEEEQLLNWVTGGGHLVLVPRRAWDEDTESSSNHLFDRFGVRLRHAANDSQSDDETGIETPAVDGRRPVAIRRTDPASGSVQRYQVAFNPSRSLEDSSLVAEESVYGTRGIHMLAWTHGAGRLTVFSDNGFMLNDTIGDYDHAWFVSDLLQGHDRIWFLVDAAMPPLTSLMWRYIPEAVASAILLGLLWLWRAAATHGPRHRTRARVRRNVIEHLDAVAAFAWRHDRRALIDRSRMLVETRWIRRHPRLNQLDEPSRCAWIAERTGLDPEHVRSALYASSTDEHSIIRSAALQQRLIGFLGGPADTVEEKT